MQIKESLRFSMNKHFLQVLERFPDFISQGGKFSIFAHSLGSIIAYDILSECKEEVALPIEARAEADGQEDLHVQLLKARLRCVCSCRWQIWYGDVNWIVSCCCTSV